MTSRGEKIGAALAKAVKAATGVTSAKTGAAMYRTNIRNVPKVEGLPREDGWVDMQVQFLIDKKSAGAAPGGGGAGGPGPPRRSWTTESSSLTASTWSAAWPANQAPTASLEKRSVSSTFPSQGSTPVGGTNSVVASSSMRSSGDAPTLGCWPALSSGGGSGTP